MRIWIIHQHAMPSIGKGPTRHFDLAKKLIEQGHEVVILAGNYCHFSFKYIAAPYHKTNELAYYSKVPFVWFGVPSYKKNSIKRMLNMIVFAYKIFMNRKLNALPRPDVIIGSSPSPFAAYAAQKIASRFNIPFIYEIRDLWPETLLSLGSFSKKHPLVRIMKRIEDSLLTRADKIISVLPGVEEYVTAKGISKDKIKWLPNSVDLNNIIYQNRTDENRITVLYAGSFNISNDVETLLHAAKILQATHKNIQFKLMGNGPLKARLQQIVSSLRLQNVVFVPMVGKEEVHNILCTADICVGMVKKSNLYRYGTSLNKITDYLATARPIVFALDSPYSPITEANAGFTVAPENPMMLAEAISKLAALPTDQRTRLGLNGRRYAEQYFNLDKIAISLITHLQT